MGSIINLGTINNLTAALDFARKEGSNELASGLKSLAQAAVEAAELEDQTKKELLEQISALAVEVGKPAAQSQAGILRALINSIGDTASTIVNLQAAWNVVEPLVKQFIT